MVADNREALELEKLRAEILKLDRESKAANGAPLRAWITSLSVVAGVLFTIYQVKEVAANIVHKERQLWMESRIRSHQLFLGIVPRMSGVESLTDEFDKDGVQVKREKKSFGGVTQAGAYSSAVALACEFPELRLPAEAALTFQLTVQPKDVSAETMLERITGGCEVGYDRMTDAERDRWRKIVNSKEYKSAE